eukprot:59983-Rhodomonas_salina.3
MHARHYRYKSELVVVPLRNFRNLSKPLTENRWKCLVTILPSAFWKDAEIWRVRGNCARAS